MLYCKYYIQGLYGVMYDPYSLTQEEITQELIQSTLVSLTRICRFAGKTEYFYSVGQHTLEMCNLFPERSNEQKWVLIHEFFEGLTGLDVASPMKRRKEMEEYVKAENRVLALLAKKYGLSPRMPTKVKEADEKMMVTEALALMSHNFDWTSIAEPYEFITIKKEDMDSVAQRLIDLWNRCFEEQKPKKERRLTP